MARTIDTVRETPHWSYSAFNTYLTCPMHYYFRYIEHAEVEKNSVSIPFGRAFHAVLSERAMKGTSYTIEDAKEEFDFFFRGETEVCENLVYKQDEDYWFWNQRGCDMLDVALADWQDDYTVKSAAEAFSVEVPGLSKPLIGEFDLVVTDGGDETICDWKRPRPNGLQGKPTVIFRQRRFATPTVSFTVGCRCSGSTCSRKRRIRRITSSTRSERTMISTVSSTSPGESRRPSTAASSSRSNLA